MLQLFRLTALVSIVYIALNAIGKTSASVNINGFDEQAAVVCTYEPPIQSAVHAVDYAEAVLIANGEMYFGHSTLEIRNQIALLPRYEDADGISAAEEQALDQLLQYGRQLAYAEATETLANLVSQDQGELRVASADDGISIEMLQALREGC